MCSESDIHQVKTVRCDGEITVVKRGDEVGDERFGTNHYIVFSAESCNILPQVFQTVQVGRVHNYVVFPDILQLLGSGILKKISEIAKPSPCMARFNTTCPV